ncbi:ABC transporter substrate-binding protein [Halomonas sp. TBZ9]|uniref:ABC transporter substrate-binding protein n=1 Tax=Vreelandella azerica TaxID=2732867 RepID=A0A7Y3TW08_9GAMM|nr:ABC transporter substrate-binding protein [Halomonas azerica]NOG31130.1 ABC transporter substrate-binding protein [Halomonas azerica]
MAVAPPEPLTPPPLEPVNIMLDWFLSPQHAVILLAHEKGFFQQQRLEVSWQIPGDPSLPTKLLAAGEIDLALGRQTQLHLAAHDGAPLTRIASLVKTPLNAIVTINKGEDADLDALGSKPLGFATQEGQQLVLPLLISETVRQSEHYAKPRAVHFETADSLNEGELEAIADAFFHTLPSRLATQGQSATVIRYDALSIPRYDGLIVMANRNTVGRRMETWVRFVVALEEAANWIIEHPDEALDTVTAAYPRLDSSLTDEHWQDLLRRLALSPAALDIRRYRAMETFLQQRGITSEILTVEQLAIDPHLGQ